MCGLLPIAGQSVYLILPPSFPEIQFTETKSWILVHNFGPENSFIANVTVNGQPVLSPLPNMYSDFPYFSGRKIGFRIIFLQRG
jgi:hypothetical protein